MLDTATLRMADDEFRSCGSVRLNHRLTTKIDTSIISNDLRVLGEIAGRIFISG